MAIKILWPQNLMVVGLEKFTRQVGMLTDLEDHKTGIFFYEISAAARDTHSSK